MDHKNHPYHYYVDKTLKHRLLDFGVPALCFLYHFTFYNGFKFTPSEMVKTTGLVSIALLSLTLIIGPLSRFFPNLSALKAHRKFWGISSFFFALLHFALVFNFYLKLDFQKLVDFGSPRYPALAAGLLALLVLAAVTLTSSKILINRIPPKLWKGIQLTSYFALILAISHFYLAESVNGVLVIKRLVGQLTFGFAIVTLITRVVVLVLPRNK